MTERVQGCCPMGCGESLFLGSGGHVTCSALTCPNPCAVDELLADVETDHVVVLDEQTFAIQHPLRERLRGELFDCGLHTYLRSLDGPPGQPGRYRVQWRPPAPLEWIPLPAMTTTGT